MLVSLNWLNDYVDISDLSPEEVADLLTDLGLEVEGIENTDKLGDEVVVGAVVDAAPHPNADSLKVCKVDVGDAEPLQIVCGAPNARKGMKAVVAKVGSTLPGNFKIKKSKIRGETSFGMMCSERELELGDNHDGIIDLPPNSPVGVKASKALGLEDHILELSITPNRADCLGYLGIARDLAARLGRPLKAPQLSYEPAADISTEGNVTIKVASGEECFRFCAIYIQDVSPVSSPRWLQTRLISAGMRPINLIVDVTNYVMLEYSQPIHAYDERDVAGRTIEVRRARPGETIKSLDGQTRSLEDEDLLIADEAQPIGIAGIMGGENSEVKDDTRNIIVEVASFDPLRIRKTARRLGLHTEASHRFERGIDVDVLPRVAKRVADLLNSCSRELTDGGVDVGAPKIAPDVLDAYPGEISKRVVTLRASRCRNLLGLPTLQSDEMANLLSALEFELIDRNEDRLVFEIPHWRGDIEREVDLIEEVGRLYGYDKIPYQTPVMNIAPTPENPFVGFLEDVRNIVAGSGMQETVSFPFLSLEDCKNLQLTEGHGLYPSLTLANPLSEDQKYLQTSAVFGLLKATKGNRRHGEYGARLFEFGRGYYDPHTYASKADVWNGKTTSQCHLTWRARQESDRPVERHYLAALIDQPMRDKSWLSEETPATFFDGKAFVISWLEGLGISDLRFSPITGEDLPYLHPRAAALIYSGSNTNTPIGYLGELHPRTTAALDFGVEAPILVELDLEKVFDASLEKREFKALERRFPPVTRDLALLVDTSVTNGAMSDAISAFRKKRNLSRFNLFDVYQGDRVPEGKKSLAYRFYFQSADRTLTDKEVDKEIKSLTDWLSDQVGAVQR